MFVHFLRVLIVLKHILENKTHIKILSCNRKREYMVLKIIPHHCRFNS